MSYCRFSCLNGYSDVYVYADTSGGWTTHVAGQRPPAGKPYSGLELALVGDGTETHPAWVLFKESELLEQEWSDANPAQPIDHPEAGESFNHSEPGECADNLERLKSEGFIIPFGVIQQLRSEQAELDKAEVAL